MSFELRQLRMFVAVADELHFSRAAAALHISQSALSQQVRTLEKDLGVILFERSSHSVSLTEVGRALRAAATRVLFEAERAEVRVREAAAGTRGTLVVGSVGSALASITPKIVARMNTVAPDVRIELSLLDTATALVALCEQRLDVAIVRAAEFDAEITREPLLNEPLVVALPAGHHRACEPYVEITDLAAEPFVLWPRQSGPEFFDTIIGYCRRHGFSPRVAVEGEDIHTQLGLVAAGLGVSLLPSYWTNLRTEGVQFRELRPHPPLVALQLAWRRRDLSPTIRHFLEAARTVASSQTRDARPDRVTGLEAATSTIQDI